ncbi:hypothetical protein DITRI_Ditri10aG0034500 [Diplodiscus trichospermus]
MDIDMLLPYLNSNVAGSFAILLFGFLLFRWSVKSSKGQKPPEAAGGWPLIGHLHVLAGSQLPYLALGDLANKYGPIFTIRVGLNPAVVVSSSELTKEIFTTYDVAVSSRPKLTVGNYIGYNYANFGFSPYGAYWRELRKITASQLLSNSRLELLKHVRASEVESSIKELYKLWTKKKAESNHVLVEMKQWFGELNLNVILRMIAGKRFSGAGVGSEEEEARRCRKAMREFFHFSGLFVVRDAIPFLGWLDLGRHEKAMKKSAKEMDSIMEEWLEEHRRKKESIGEEAAKGDQDFIDVLLSVLEGIDLAGYDVNTVTKATVSTLLAGGTDTTTVTITWTLALLLNNRHALEKAQEELDSQIGNGRLVNESDIDKLIYLQAIVKESLRLYPAGPLAGAREFAEDCTVGGYLVPKGTRLILNLWKIQRDPKLWSDPLEFKPERFISSHSDIDVKGQDFELMPFGAGRRLCPGINYGLQMTHLVLASLLHAFDILNPSNEPVDMTGSPGLTNIKATPLEILAKPRLPPSLYQ